MFLQSVAEVVIFLLQHVFPNVAQEVKMADVVCHPRKHSSHGGEYSPTHVVDQAERNSVAVTDSGEKGDQGVSVFRRHFDAFQDHSAQFVQAGKKDRTASLAGAVDVKDVTTFPLHGRFDACLAVQMGQRQVNDELPPQVGDFPLGYGDVLLR